MTLSELGMGEGQPYKIEAKLVCSQSLVHPQTLNAISFPRQFAGQGY